MKKPVSATAASAKIDERIEQLGDWRGKMLAKMRKLIHDADPEIVEEWKWMGTPIFSHSGIVCTGETYKSVVKLTFAKGASLKDPAKLFNSSMDGNVRRAIDIHEGEPVNEAALKALIRAAVALNVESKSKPKAARASKTAKPAPPGKAAAKAPRAPKKTAKPTGARKKAAKTTRAGRKSA